MAPHSSTLAWKIAWTEEPGRLQSMGSRRVRQNWATSLSRFTLMQWRRKWQPTPVFLLENPRDGGIWWAAVYGVAQSRTRLKQLSSSSSSSSSMKAEREVTAVSTCLFHLCKYPHSHSSFLLHPANKCPQVNYHRHTDHKRPPVTWTYLHLLKLPYLQLLTYRSGEKKKKIGTAVFHFSVSSFKLLNSVTLPLRFPLLLHCNSRSWNVGQGRIE